MLYTTAASTAAETIEPRRHHPYAAGGTSETAIAIHTKSATGPAQSWNAGGAPGSHGRRRSPESASGASEAVRRASQAHAPAAATASQAVMETGRTAIRS